MKANIEIGWINEWFEGESANEIFSKVENYQDFGCLISMGYANESENGIKEIAKIEKLVKKYWNNELTVNDLKKINYHLSIGDFICHEVIE